MPHSVCNALSTVDFEPLAPARINNAGSNAYKYGLLSEAFDADLVSIVETNVLGVMLGCREVSVRHDSLPPFWSAVHLSGLAVPACRIQLLAVKLCMWLSTVRQRMRIVSGLHSCSAGLHFSCCRYSEQRSGRECARAHERVSKLAPFSSSQGLR